MRVRQSLTQVNWPVAVSQKIGRPSRIGCAVIGKVRMRKSEHEECDSPTTNPPSGDGMLYVFRCTKFRQYTVTGAGYSGHLRPRVSPKPLKITCKKLGPRDTVPEKSDVQQPSMGGNHK